MNKRDATYQYNNSASDYETCVLDAYPECQYDEDININDFDGNRGQMSLFCGHDPVIYQNIFLKLQGGKTIFSQKEMAITPKLSTSDP